MKTSIIPEAYENNSFFERLRPGLKGEIKALRHCARSSPRFRFFIFAQGRSGSTLLTSALDSHPSVRCLDEILGQPRLRPMAFAEHLARSAATPAFGFHVKSYQLVKWQRVADLHDFLERMWRRGWKIIYLWRENVFNQTISNIFAEVSGKYHFTEDDKERVTVNVDISYLLKYMEWRLATQACERTALHGVPHVEVRYERDLLDDDARVRTFESIQKHIGVDPAPLSSPLRKAVNRPLHEIVSNYDEIEAALRGTEFERWLTEADRTAKETAAKA